LVATVRALKYHGGADLKSLSQKNLVALKKGIPNIERHASIFEIIMGYLVWWQSIIGPKTPMKKLLC
jgi:formyltetrahydrofolate synthetase